MDESDNCTPVSSRMHLGSSHSPRTVVSLGPTQSRMGPTNTGPKFRANIPTVHNTANLLSCVGQSVSDPPAFRNTADKQASAHHNVHLSVLRDASLAWVMEKMECEEE